MLISYQPQNKTKQKVLFISGFVALLLLPLMSLAQPVGANMSNPVVMGTYGTGTFSYTDTKNNSTANGYLNDYGQAGDDIYYKFIVQGNAQVVISHCSSGFDTYMHLLNSTGALVTYNDDNGPSCAGSRASISTTLTAGTYYIVSEGFGTLTGAITTAVNLTIQPAVPSDTRNFIKVWDATAPETDGNTLMTKNLRDVKHSVTYFDGLGRAEQNIVKKGSLSTSGNTDLVSPVVYDAFGREAQKYLPYMSPSGDGLYKSSILTEQNTFYTGASSPVAGQGETYFYSKTDFEASPLNRPVKSYAPGNSWVGANRGVEVKYWINTVTDDVKKWNVTNVANSFGTYAINGYYPAGELYKNVTVDEHTKQVIEFKDKEGKVILKKVQLTAVADIGTGRDYTGWLCTYYIYDDLNNLRCVIQPEGVKAITGTWSLTTDLLNEQCFRYEYDARNRMIMKKVPGAGEVYMVYDARDRLMMTQDANLRVANKWMVTLYDDINRPVQTGLLLNTFNGKTFVQHLSAAYAVTDYPFTPTTTPTVTYWEYLTKTGYDVYTTIPAASGLNNTFDGSWATHFNGTYNTSPLYAQQQTASLQTKGMVTWTEIKVLGTSTYLYTVPIYDDKGRVIQVKAKNLTGGIDISTTQYTWAGQPLISVQKQEKAGASAQITVVVTQMTYDDLGRVTKTEKKLSNTLVNSNGMSAYKTISENEYDALGQLKKKKLAPAFNSNAGLETLTYDYNIRGWMLGANRDYIKDIATNYFGFDLGYDKNGSLGTYTPLYNGNISGTVWKSKGDAEKRKYDFTYDAVNRLTGADFNQWVSGTGVSAAFNKSANIDFSVSNLTFDANGNILTMTQKGLKLNASPIIDNLRYTYQTSSNKLKSVTDFNNDALTKLGDFKTNTTHPQNGAKSALITSSPQSSFDAITDYSYDVNGNLSLDNNKTISSSTYNHLNLPSVITVTGKGTITYTYDAAGNKLKKITSDISIAGKTITTTTTYLGGTVYESKTTSPANSPNDDYTDVLQFIGHEEGRIRFKPVSGTIPASFQYDYMIKDHLGNVRMVLTEEQQQDQYPASTLEGSTTAGALSMINYEKKFYTINDTYVVNSSTMPGWTTGKDYQNNNGNPPYNLSYPSGSTPTATATSAKVYKLNATTNKTGLSMVLKVMAGDKIDIHGKSYYQSATTYNNANSTLLTLSDVIGTFIGSPDNAGFIGKGISSPTMQTINTGLIPANFFRGNDGSSSGIPKAYINYIFFDEQFKYAGGGFSRAGASGTVKNHWFTDAVLQNIPVPENGYLYVYVSNESNDNVFFDNLQVFHTRGPVLEETHYYPFGLTMAGISSKALAFGGAENKYKWNAGSELASKEFSDGSGLELYETFYRSLDPQIGRFWQIDPEIEAQENFSPYESMGNNPITNVDPLGDFKTRFGAWLNRLFNGGGKIGENEFGEWYVTKKGEVKISADQVWAFSYYYYGKGRDQYSTAREALSRDIEIMTDIHINGDKSMYQMYDSPEEAGKAALGLGTGTVLLNPILKGATATINAGNNISKVLTRAERLSLFKEKLLNAPMPKNPKEALKLINKILNKVENSHAGANDKMFGILDNKYVTFNSNGSVTALTKGHRIEIQSNGSFSIFERSTGSLFLSK